MVIISPIKKFLGKVLDKFQSNGSKVANPRFVGSSSQW